jgi:DnaJ-domain-containing protein 1
MNIKNNKWDTSKKLKEEDRLFKNFHWKILIEKIVKVDAVKILHREMQKTLKKYLNFKI